jgi:Domain of unknown function (DUF4936)
VTNYYVYYRVDAARAVTLRTEIEKLLEKIQKQSGVRGRWLHRRDDPSTYMEVYEGVADDMAFDALLEREAAGMGLERRVERFVCA